MADKKIPELYERYLERMRSVSSDVKFEHLLDELSSGKNTYLRMDSHELSTYDPAWIDMIEGVLFDLGEIVSNPRQNTKTVSDLSPIELAKKIKGESVQHLASHTQYIKEIDDYGNVIPSKILSFSNEDNILTYENRFIATFIRKLLLFIEKRYEFAAKFASLHNREVLYMKNQSIVDGAQVEIETKIKITSESESEEGMLNNAYFARIEQVREYIRFYYNSPFMRMFKTENNVRNPILQTNIIRKNPKYRHCYEVYKYIERYNGLGIEYKMNEEYSVFNEHEIRKLNYALFGTYLTLHGQQASHEKKEKTKVYKPKILTSMDDESFVYGPLLQGPIEFVRIDEGYQNYLESLLPQDLPLHPNKKLREYYAQEYTARKDYAEWAKQKAALIRRKERELKLFELEVDQIVKKRELERLRLEALQMQLIKEEEDSILNKIREEIIAQALRDRMMDTGIPSDEQSESPLPEMDEGMYLGEGEAIKLEEPEEEKEEVHTLPIRYGKNGKPLRYVIRKIKKGRSYEGHLLPPGETAEQMQQEEMVESPSFESPFYLVETPRGYYVDEDEFDFDIAEAHRFDNFEAAEAAANLYEGKVVRP